MTASSKEMPPGIKWTLVISALMTILGPFIGILGTVLGMVKSFAVLGESGIANMTGLSTSLSAVLFSTVAGIFIGLIGLIIFVSVLFSWLSSRKSAQKMPSP